jgi:hypothetical protein
VIDATPYTSNTGISSNIPDDDTVPTSSEGDEVLTANITPNDNSNKIAIKIDGFALSLGTGSTAIAALFRGTTCIRTWKFGTNGTYVNFSVSHKDSPASTSQLTYSVRIGATGSGVIWLNGSNTTRLFGGTASWTMALEEIEA